MNTLSVTDIWGEIGGKQRMFYPFNGETVAMLKGGQYLFLHSDHLGSASLITNVNGQVVGQTEFDPWGKVRTGGQDATTRSFTGQELDTSGLLFYKARYYDPSIGRFLSADTVVPGDPSGGMSRPTYFWFIVTFREAGFCFGITKPSYKITKPGFRLGSRKVTMNQLYRGVNSCLVHWYIDFKDGFCAIVAGPTTTGRATIVGPAGLPQTNGRL